MSTAVPLPYGFWLPDLAILAGEYPGSPPGSDAWRDKLNRLRNAGITYFCDLTEVGELEPYLDHLQGVWPEGGVEYRRFPIRDGHVPSLDQMGRILDSLSQALEDGHTVYLHCWGGVGRTGTVACCLLVRNGYTPEHAIQTIRRLFSSTSKGDRRIPETDVQVDFVSSYR